MPITYEHRLPAWVRGLGHFAVGAGQGATASEMAEYQQQQQMYDRQSAGLTSAIGQAAQYYQQRQLLGLRNRQQQSLMRMQDARSTMKAFGDALGLSFGINQEALEPIATTMSNAFKTYMDPDLDEEVKIEALQTAHNQITQAMKFASEIRPKQPTYQDQIEQFCGTDPVTGQRMCHPRMARVLDSKDTPAPMWKVLGYKSQEDFYNSAEQQIKDQRIDEGLSAEETRYVHPWDVFAKMSKIFTDKGPHAFQEWIQAGSPPAPKAMPEAAEEVPADQWSARELIRQGIQAGKLGLTAAIGAARGPGRPVPKVAPVQSTVIGGPTAVGGEQVRDVTTAPESGRAFGDLRERPITPTPMREEIEQQTEQQIQAEQAAYNAISELDAIAAREGTDNPAQWSDEARNRASVIAMHLKEAVKVRYPDFNAVPAGLKERLRIFANAGLIQ